MTLWSNAEVSCLVSLWGEDTVQGKKQGCDRNKSVFEDIADEMVRRGFMGLWLQCQRKITSLKCKTVKDYNNRSGNSPITFPFYDQMDGILGDKPTCLSPQILDSFREDDVASSLDFEELENINVTGKDKLAFF